MRTFIKIIMGEICTANNINPKRYAIASGALSIPSAIFKTLCGRYYGTVLIPEAVYQELTDPNFPVAGAIEVQTFIWIQTRPVQDRILVEALSNELDIGEAEAIALA
jgi:hypothetical protein